MSEELNPQGWRVVNKAGDVICWLPDYDADRVTTITTLTKRAEEAELERDAYRAALRDDEAPMESDGDEMTAAESVLAYLYVEVVGAPDDEAVSPLKAQKAIEDKLRYATAAERRLAEAERVIAPFVAMANSWVDDEPDETLMDYHDEDMSLTLGQCRAARKWQEEGR